MYGLIVVHDNPFVAPNPLKKEYSLYGANKVYHLCVASTIYFMLGKWNDKNEAFPNIRSL